MSKENVEVVRQLYEAWNAGDRDASREMHDPDVILRPENNWPEPGPYIGREAVMRFYEQLREAWDADTLELTGDFSHAADRVVARWVWHAQGHGPESNMEVTVVFTFRNGKVREVDFFWDHNEALEAAGLRE
jgi:ketosteroid isomerase-like protein